MRSYYYYVVVIAVVALAYYYRPISKPIELSLYCVSPATYEFYSNNENNSCVCPIVTGNEPCAFPNVEKILNDNEAVKSDKLQVALIWTTGMTFSDLELALILPDGTVISPSNKVSATGAVVQMDNQGTDLLVENIYWPSNCHPSSGVYTVSVSMFSFDIEEKEKHIARVPITIFVRNKGKITHVASRIKSDGIQKIVYRFEYKD